MELKEVLEMLSDSEKFLDIDAVIALINLQASQIEVNNSIQVDETLVAVYKAFGLEPDEKDVLLSSLAAMIKDKEELLGCREKLAKLRKTLIDKIVGKIQILSGDVTESRPGYVVLEELSISLASMSFEQLESELEKCDQKLCAHFAIPSVTDLLIQDKPVLRKSFVEYRL